MIKTIGKTLLLYCILAVLFMHFNVVQAQDVENEYQPRTAFQLSYKPVKKLKLSLTPELRFDDKFSLDEYLVEGMLAFKPIKILTLDASYRFIGNLRTEKPTEYFGRYAFSAKAKKKIERFEPSLRLRYSNYDDDEITDKKFLRYKGSIDYNIKNCKLNPYVSAEAFHQLDNKRINKMRYSGGFDYKLFKKNYIGLSYKLDYYRFEYRNRHIISLDYKIKL